MGRTTRCASPPPAKGARLGAAPQQVDLVFAERLDPKFTTIAVTAPGDTAAVAGAPAVSGTRATQTLQPGLPAGEYTVAYRVVSVDGHPVQGSFTFTVTAAPAASAPASAPPVAASSAAPQPTSASPAAAVDTAADGGGVSPALPANRAA